MEKSDYSFEIKPRQTFSINLKELLDYKELFYYFTWRDIKVKYRQTFLGVLWAMLQPLMMMTIFTLFIGRSFGIPSDQMSYPVFAYSGLILWFVFASGLSNAGNSMITNAQMIKKIYFPRLIIPLSSILVSVFDFAVAFLPFIPMLLYFDQPVSVVAALWCWPAGILLTMMGSFGPGCLLAALNIKYRDFRYVIPFLIQVLLFVTPVIYPMTIVPGRWLQYILALNPMYGAITVFRLPMTPVSPDATLLLISVVSSMVWLIIGLGYFRKTESYFADLA